MPTPNIELVQRVRDLYANKVKDVRVLIPVLSGLSKQEILNALPKLLKLNQVVVKEVFNRLLGIGAEFANQTMAATPTDILICLHTIDTNSCDIKLIVKATSICLAEKEVYTSEVLIGVLQQLVEVVPIPTLLMRTIIQSLTLYPRMSNFVLNLLQRLILKQVWRQKIIWDGFLKCVQRLKPQSLPVLLHLPAQQLQSALHQCPDLRAPLLEYAESIQDEPMSGITPQILDIITGQAQDVFITVIFFCITYLFLNNLKFLFYRMILVVLSQWKILKKKLKIPPRLAQFQLLVLYHLCLCHFQLLLPCQHL